MTKAIDIQLFRCDHGSGFFLTVRGHGKDELTREEATMLQYAIKDMYKGRYLSMADIYNFGKEVLKLSDKVKETGR